MGELLDLFPKKRSYGKFQILSEGLAKGSTPTPTDSELSLEGVDSGRRVMCRRQAQCVTFAASQKWISFRCDNCSVVEILSTEEQRQDIEGLAMLLSTLDLSH